MLKGDLHYKNIGTNDPKKYESATRNVVTDFSGRKLFSSVPVAYMVSQRFRFAPRSWSVSQ